MGYHTKFYALGKAVWESAKTSNKEFVKIIFANKEAEVTLGRFDIGSVEKTHDEVMNIFNKICAEEGTRTLNAVRR